MNWSSENLMRGRVLRDWDVDLATPVTPADLGTVSARSARGIVVSPELVESARQEGYTAGFEEGYAAGYTHGIDDARRHVELLGQLVQQLGREADALAAREATARADIEDQVVAAALQHRGSARRSRARTARRPRPRRDRARARARARARRRHRPPAPGRHRGAGRSRPSSRPGACSRSFPTRRSRRATASSTSPSCRVDARVGAAIERAREVLS